MKQVININFQGRVVPIEVAAFELLKKYTDSLNRYFANEDGKEEIINDIENRIGELFQERLKAGTTCITEDDVNAVIKSIGRPEEFESNEDNTSQSNSAGQKADSSQTGNITGTYKRLYRDENNKILGGVCSGIANYFNIDPVIVRIIAVIIFGVFFVPYIILWIAVPSSATKEIGSTRKKLYRDTDDKIIAGICSGISNYFGINPWIPRAIFLIPFLSFIFHWNIFGFPNFFHVSFSPGAIMIYIILWIVVPEAITTAEKLEMKGEKVDIHSIKNSIVEEMKDVKQRAKKFAEDKNITADMSNTAKRTRKSLGDILFIILKGFAYFIIGCVAFALVASLLAIAFLSIGIFPVLNDFLLRDGWQTIFAWGTLLFFISVPVIGVVTWIIRRIAKAKSNSKILRFTFISLWTIGWVSFIFLLASVTKDFKIISSYNEEEIKLSNSTINKLEITSVGSFPKHYHSNWFKIEPFATLDDDTAYLKNINLHIVRSSNDSFKVTMVKIAYGRDKHAADTLANAISFNVVQEDSLLIVDKGIAITQKDKFRNQQIQLTVYVPVGKQIRIDKNIGWPTKISFGQDDDDVNIDIDNESKGWDENTDYIMKADGLYTLDGKPADMNNIRSEKKIKVNGVTINSDDDDDDQENNLDSINPQLLQQYQQIKDSLQKIKRKIDKQSNKANDEDDNDPQARNSYRSQLYSPFSNI
ncbi:MAG: PspC domain-containing protein [Ferruginibacter sp.]